MIATDLAQSGRVQLYGITFDSDSDHLRSEAKPTPDQIVAAMKANESWKIEVEGYADSTSTPPHNQDLSTRRAAAVKSFLVSAGVAGGRIASAGFGQDEPVASLGRALNRSVEPYGSSSLGYGSITSLHAGQIGYAMLMDPGRTHRPAVRSADRR